MKSRCSFIAVTILILTLTLVCVGCTDGEAPAKDEQPQFYTSTITDIASAVPITVEAPTFLNEAEIPTEKAEEVIGNSVEEQTPPKTKPAQTSSQSENHLTPESTSPVSPTPPSDYSPPDYFE